MNTTVKTLIALIMVLTLVPGAELAKAEVSLGTPINLGPAVNSPSSEATPSISGDGLELYFGSDRPGGYGDSDIWVATRPTTDDEWGEAVNLGPVVNSSAAEGGPTISHDGLTLYFSDFNAPRPGGHGEVDLWVTTRAAKDEPWGEPVNLGPTVNSPKNDVDGSISDDGLELYFMSNRDGGYGSYDLWVTTRTTTEDEWGEAVNLGPTLNSPNSEHCPSISADGLTLFFDITVKTADGKRIGDLMVTQRTSKDDDWGEPVNLGHEASDHFSPSLSVDGSTIYFWADRPGGSGSFDIWQAPVLSKSSDEAAKALAEEIVALELATYKTWYGESDPTSYAQQFADKATYFDARLPEMIEDHAIKDYLMTLAGKIPNFNYKLLNPRVDLYGDVAVFAFNLELYDPKDGKVVRFWKSTAVLIRTKESWEKVHAHWTLVGP